MLDKCKIISVRRNAKHFWYKYHGLFVRTYNNLSAKLVVAN